MKYYLLLVCFFLISTSYGQSYSKEWEEIYKLEKAGSYKTAYEKVETIFKKAKRKKNNEQKAKAFLYKLKFQNQLKENTAQNIVTEITSELQNSKGVYETLYRWYYIQAVYNQLQKKSSYYHRTVQNTTVKVPDNIEEWSAEHYATVLKEQSALLFKNETLLKDTKIKDIKELVEYDFIDENLNQTTYEFFAYNYIKRFSENYIWQLYNQPQFQNFKNDFCTTKIILPQQNNVQDVLNEVIVKLYQDLEKYYTTTNNDYGLDKIKFYRYSKTYDTTLKVLDELGANLKTDFYKNRYKIERAKYLVNNADKIEHKDYFQKALQLSKELRTQTTENDALENAIELENTLQKSDFNISLVKEVYENEPVKYFVNYKNLNQLHFAYYDIKNQPDNINDSIYKHIVKNQQPVEMFTATLPQGEKYFSYSTEVLGKKLPLGSYLLVAYEDKAHLENSYRVKYHTFKVTNVMVVNKNAENQEAVVFYFVHPQTGKPYANTLVAINTLRFTTDADGKVLFKLNDKNERDFNVQVFLTNETYKTYIGRNWDAPYISSSYREVWVEPLLYTDRAIYRPGQEVHFKGILYKKAPERNEAVKNKTIQLILKDDNDDEVEIKTVTTNDLGSFSGSFILPKNSITGDFEIEIDELEEYTNEEEAAFWKEFPLNGTYKRFKVEEYKRPTFTVEVDEIKKNVFFNEEVEIVGKAKSLAGGAIANAKVVLDIKSSDYSFEDFFSKKDTLTTDDKGEFRYKLIIPSISENDTIQNENTRISIDYKVEVTDNAGEVREADDDFYVSNYATYVSVYAKNNMVTNEKLKLAVNTKTQNGDDKSVTGTIKIYQSLPPKDFYLMRLWQVPELASIDEKTFREQFPYETYTNKDNAYTEKKIIYEAPFTTEKDKPFTHDISKWETGTYEFVFETTDEKSKQPLSATTSIQVKKANEIIAPNQNLQVTTHSSSSAKELVLQVVSIYDATHLYLEVFDTNAQLIKKVVNVANGSQLVKIPLTKSNENKSVRYQWYYIKNHFTFLNEDSYEIPSTVNEKALYKAEWEVWNNKLIPGNAYEWKVKLLADKSKKPMQGEFLATMYDASLDLIYKDYWTTETELNTKSSYVNFGYLNFNNKVDANDEAYLRTSFYYNQSFNINQFNYFGYGFTTDDYVNTNYQDYLPKDYFNSKASFKQIEVRDAETQAVINNAYIYNITNADVFMTNNQGFGRIWATNKQPIAINALGYQQKRLQLNNAFTVVYLQPTHKEITNETVDQLAEETYELHRLYRIYNHLKADASYSEKKELKFIDDVIKKDTELKDYNDEMVSESEEGALDEIVVTTYRTSSKSESAVAATTVTSCTLEGRPNASFIQTLQGQVPGLNISTAPGQPGNGNTILLRGLGSINDTTKPLVVLDGVPVSESQLSLLESDIYDITVLKDAGATAIYGNRGANGVIVITTKKAQQAAEHLDIPLRKNLSETAFFLPHLKIEKNGTVQIKFNAPEALTQWKFKGLAHNEKLETVYTELLSQTQKDVMIQPNMPRFVRETDAVVLKARVSNTTTVPLQATAVLRLFNTITGEELTDKIIKTNKLVPTTINGLSANTVSWQVHIPENLEGLQYRISVKAGNFTDGEESVIPVLNNRMLVTETIPVWQLANENKEYNMQHLLNNNSQTLKNHQYKVQVSNNMLWVTMQSLPYLFDYQHNCNEQLFAKYFADVLALHVLDNHENVEKLVTEWQKNPQAKLEQNQEVKQLMLQETPWLKDFVNDKEKQAQWANYFNRGRLEKEATEIVKTLGERQNASGGFGWFSGGYENDYITQHILVTAAQLQRLEIDHFNETDVKNIINKAHRFIDVKMQEQLKNKTGFSNSSAIDYAFVKSYYTKDFTIPKDVATELEKNFTNLKENWVSLSLYSKAKLALVVQRKGDKEWAQKITHQLTESAVIDETYGMYWKENDSRNYYYFNAAETQALIIEAFAEVENNQTTVQKLSAWLLSQKLNKDWGTTKATTSAVYALLLSKTANPEKNEKVIIKVGSEKINTKEKAENETDALLGYQTYEWSGDEVTNNLGKVAIKNKTNQPVFGGIYWQYFEDLSKIKASANGILNISKMYFITNAEGKLQEITPTTPLQLGQKVTIRLKVNATKDMEFVHIKDVRAATFEPVDVLSGYQYKNNLRYYQSTRDAATNFFIDYLNKGSYVIDYEIRLNNEGTFTSGVSTIQSMYAPEHSAHSNAETVKVNP